MNPSGKVMALRLDMESRWVLVDAVLPADIAIPVLWRYGNSQYQ
ncbi:hypothetical protein GA0061070_10419 [Kosakonia oryziphila]|uniref:Uncharacterized protein n=1 Tax=Kosakonia oryziphila TaxID=1005667 RepID=A0A1C4FRS4_9ENTR|nr:hypothetical protein GA0061070_10419 [Kosakonia oryziphila]